MKLDTGNIRPGMPGICSPSQWNQFARAVNTLWNSRASSGVTLTKGSPWLYQSDSATAAGLAFDAAAWQIYVYRPSSANDWDNLQAPSAVYLTGPFTRCGGRTSKHIVKLTNQGYTKVDTAFAAGFEMTGGQAYYQQRMSRNVTGDLLVQSGQYIEDLGGTPGIFFSINITNGSTTFAPYTNILTLLPSLPVSSVTGVACNGDTIAVSLGISDSGAGVVLFDTAGTPQIADAGASSYIYQTGTTASYFWIIADTGSYYFQTQTDGTAPYLHKVNGTQAAGIVDDATFTANGGSGGIAEYPAVIRDDSAFLALATGEWNGTTATSNISFLSDTAGAFITGLAGFPSVPAIPLCFGGSPSVNGIGEIQHQLVFTEGAGGDNTKLYLLRLNYSPTTLTTLTGFNGQITDCKFFRRKNDNLTDQFIVCGEFTEYQGQPAAYMVFIDQNGNRLTDLEWA